MTAVSTPASLGTPAPTASTHHLAALASSTSSNEPRTLSVIAVERGLHAAATPAPLATLAAATHHDLSKTIYLTFDDGPDPTWTPEILALLEHYGAHASFFVIGEDAKKWPGLVEREAHDGDTVGDHTWSHPNLTDMSASTAHIELGRDENWITKLTGQAPTLWRPPYEAFNASVEEVASGLGMKMQLWSVDTED